MFMRASSLCVLLTTQSLLGVEIDMRAMGRRKGLLERLEDVVSRHGYDGFDDALEWALRCAGCMSEID